MNENVFAIFKISYNSLGNQAEGGVCGSCFFINQTEFITAHHVLNNKTYTPNSGYENVKVFLVNSLGEIIYNPRIKKLHPEYDLTIGVIDKKIQFYPSAICSSKDYLKKEVFNLGYGQKGIKKYSLKTINNDLSIINLQLDLQKQKGIIEETKIATINARDIKFEKRKMLIVDYTLELGFSGGPLILLETNEIVGFMSLLLPNGPSNRAAAISINEIKHLL